MLEIHGQAVITQAIAFVLLAWFFGKFVFGPVRNQIDGRQQEIQSTLDQLADDRKAMEQTRADYEKRLADIAAEERERIAAAMKQAQQEASAIIEQARGEATEQKERAVQEIDQERRKAISEIRAEMADLAVTAAGKILEREINPAVHRDLIGNFIQEVGARS